MHVVICYDVDDSKIRRKLVKYLESVAVRVQYSVFVSDLSEAAIRKMNAYVESLFKDCTKARFSVFRTNDSALHEEKLPPACIYV